ncbi:MAG: deoxyribodipyrimidine photo-lyase/cryptochrome family protein [Cyanobacteria bacterium]|nr:deoxyribodipyrimidine photo-lyase/cryptochrome family protein [Cyanobacteriota bacterium]
MNSIQVVWFKRDLRIEDHQPLREAALKGHCICLYVYEPEIIQSPEFHPSHLEFINQSLLDLDKELQMRGNGLVSFWGSMIDVLNRLRVQWGNFTLWSHEETGNNLTYQRDIEVGKWMNAHGLEWHEFPSNGVVRRLKSRDGWSKIWHQRMKQMILPPPLEILKVEASFAHQADFDSKPVYSDAFPKTGQELCGQMILPVSFFQELKRLSLDSKQIGYEGGSRSGRETLIDFLTVRGAYYQKEISSPVSAQDSCSRLSPYLTWGNLSIRQVFQETQHRIHLLLIQKEKARDEELRATLQWLRSLRSFEKRLHWHCHFIQKLEDQPSLEFQNLCRGFDGLRENAFRADYFDAWCAGQTGYPMIDACMRCLHQTGWINFRMRAMLASFAAYHLWLDWRPTSKYLAQHFIDFEPGIHYSQFQMQSGVTGINTIRIYSPTKQGIDQDPTGEFIRQFVPELAGVPTPFIHQPETLPPLLQLSYGFQVGKTYPAPLVDHLTVYKAAQEKIFALKNNPETKKEAYQVFQKHGSRNIPFNSKGRQS